MLIAVRHVIVIRYWAWARNDSTNPRPAGGGGKTYTIPGGLTFGNTSSAGYAQGHLNRSWANPSSGEVHAFQKQHWGSWMFPITGRQDNGAESLWSGNITWERGGWQEARGNEEGKEWHVEGIFEELDSAREWFHDAAAQEIYFIPNSTKTSSSTTQPGNPTEIIAAELQHIVAIVGSSAERPVSNITIRGITFSHSAPTYMEPYEAVSGGDWSFFRDGAVRIENAVGTRIEDCTFDSTGGNGLLVNGFARSTTVLNSEFYKTGDSGIVLLGYADRMDGTNGRQPRGTNITGCLMVDVGVIGKQSAGFSQALAMDTTLHRNVVYNVPRSGFNFSASTQTRVAASRIGSVLICLFQVHFL